MDNNVLKLWLIVTSGEQKVLSHLKEQFSSFQVSNGLKIKIEFLTWARAYTAMIKAFKDDNPPDVLQLGTTWVRTFAYMGYLDQLPDSINIKPAINEGINRICKYKGKKYAAPWIADTIIMAGHKGYMKKLGIKKSDVSDWQGFKGVTGKLMKWKEKDSSLPDPLAFALRVERDTLQRFSSILWSCGWEFPKLEEFTGKIFSNDLVVDTISCFADLMFSCGISDDEIEKHPYQYNEEFHIHNSYLFYIGNWYGIIEEILSESDNHCILPFPTSLTNYHTYGGGSVLVVSSRSRLKKKAWELVEFMLCEDFLKKWIESTANVPVFETEFWQRRFSDERVKLMYEHTVNSRVYPAHPAWVAVENEMVKGVVYTLWDLIKRKSTKIDVKSYSFLKKTDEKIKEILKMSWEM